MFTRLTNEYDNHNHNSIITVSNADSAGNFLDSGSYNGSSISINSSNNSVATANSIDLTSDNANFEQMTKIFDEIMSDQQALDAERQRYLFVLFI